MSNPLLFVLLLVIGGHGIYNSDLAKNLPASMRHRGTRSTIQYVLALLLGGQFVRAVLSGWTGTALAIFVVAEVALTIFTLKFRSQGSQPQNQS